MGLQFRSLSEILIGLTRAGIIDSETRIRSTPARNKILIIFYPKRKRSLQSIV